MRPNIKANVRFVFGLITCFSVALLLMGCESTRRTVLCQPAPPLPSYHDLQAGVPIKRVAILPLSFDAQNGNFTRDLDASFNAELTKTSMFEVVVISRAQMEALFGRQQYSSVGELPGNFLAQLGPHLGVDAVLFTDITHYFPYQPISIGVRSRLIDVRSGDTRWAFDYLFDSGKPAVAQAARQFFLAYTQTNKPIADEGDSVLQSPLRFSRYVAWETYRSLVNKPVPVPLVSKETNSSKVVLKSAQ